MLATTALVLWSMAVAWRGHVWLMVVPACAVFMNLSPWSGWIVFDEFDILLLGTMAGGYLRMAWPRCSKADAPIPVRVQLVLLLLGVMALWALWRALQDAGRLEFDWFAGYTGGLNSVRIFKSEGYALLFVPLLHREISEGSQQAHRRIATGMVTGLSVVVLAVLWERLAFADIFDFSRPYRTAALFWEMHVGGEAIDGYLALATPFAAWAVMSARRPLPWIASAILALLTGYAVLTTFSRGLYCAVLVSLLLLSVMRLSRDPHRCISVALKPACLPIWRKPATFLLCSALIAEVLMVFAMGTFMMERLTQSKDDFGSRIAHWQRGLVILQSATDWWLGKGPGRLPKHYSELGPDGEFSGEAHASAESHVNPPAERFVTILGPKTRSRLGGQFSLTQRVHAIPKALHAVRMDVRADTATELQIEWCVRHLLYDAGCQTAQVHLDAGPQWQKLVQPLFGPEITEGFWLAPRWSLFGVSVVNAGGRADFANIHLQGPAMQDLLVNGDFSRGLAHWLGCAQSYFLPWHIDNLYLELLIERGLSGLLIFFCLVGTALWKMTLARVHSDPLHPYLVAALTGVLWVGLTGSLLDVPRVMFLFYLLVLDGALLQPAGRAIL